MDSKSLEQLKGTYPLEILPEAVREANRSLSANSGEAFSMLSKQSINYNQTEEEVLAALQSSPVQNRYNKMMIYRDFILFWQPLDDEGNQYFDGKPSHTAVQNTIHDIPVGFGYYNDDPSFDGDTMALGPNEYGVPEVYMHGSHSVSECIDMLHEAIPNMQDIIVDFERMSIDEAREAPEMGGGFSWVESSVKDGMAQRSGEPDIDQIIQEFLSQPLPDYEGLDEDEDEIYYVMDLEDEFMSSGQCEEITFWFIEFAGERGLEVYPVYTDNFPQNTPFESSEESETDFNHGGHVWAGVEVGDEIYQIDFTASQFGYIDDFPAVFRKSDEVWQSNWSTSSLSKEGENDPEFNQFVQDVILDFERNKDRYLADVQSILPSVTDIELTGSYPEGIANEDSDIDIAVYYSGNDDEEQVHQALWGQVFGYGGMFDIVPIKQSSLKISSEIVTLSFPSIDKEIQIEIFQGIPEKGSRFIHCNNQYYWWYPSVGNIPTPSSVIRNGNYFQDINQYEDVFTGNYLITVENVSKVNVFSEMDDPEDWIVDSVTKTFPDVELISWNQLIDIPVSAFRGETNQFIFVISPVGEVAYKSYGTEGNNFHADLARELGARENENEVDKNGNTFVRGGVTKDIFFALPGALVQFTSEQFNQIGKILSQTNLSQIEDYQIEDSDGEYSIEDFGLSATASLNKEAVDEERYEWDYYKFIILPDGSLFAFNDPGVHHEDKVEEIYSTNPPWQQIIRGFVYPNEIGIFPFGESEFTATEEQAQTVNDLIEEVEPTEIIAEKYINGRTQFFENDPEYLYYWLTDKEIPDDPLANNSITASLSKEGEDKGTEIIYRGFNNATENPVESIEDITIDWDQAGTFWTIDPKLAFSFSNDEGWEQDDPSWTRNRIVVEAEVDQKNILVDFRNISSDEDIPQEAYEWADSSYDAYQMEKEVTVKRGSLIRLQRIFLMDEFGGVDKEFLADRTITASLNKEGEMPEYLKGAYRVAIVDDQIEYSSYETEPNETHSVLLGSLIGKSNLTPDDVEEFDHPHFILGILYASGEFETMVYPQDGFGENDYSLLSSIVGNQQISVASLSKEGEIFNEQDFITQPQIGNDAMLITDEFENVEEGTMGFISGKFRVEGITYYSFSPSTDPDEQIYVEDYQVEVFPSNDPMEELYSTSKRAVKVAFQRKSATGPYIDELNYLRFENDDLGSNHRFVISPEGEIYSWPKDAEDGEFGIALMALMNDGVSFNDLDEFDIYDWQEFRGQDNKDFYVSEGWIFGNTSSGSFVIINDKIGANDIQIETIKDMVYTNNFKSIVYHSKGQRMFFKRKEDFFRYLNSGF